MSHILAERLAALSTAEVVTDLGTWRVRKLSAGDLLEYHAGLLAMSPPADSDHEVTTEDRRRGLRSIDAIVCAGVTHYDGGHGPEAVRLNMQAEGGDLWVGAFPDADKMKIAEAVMALSNPEALAAKLASFRG